MKSKIISSSLLVAGFLIGASALSTLAAWTLPSPNDGETEPCDPPKCNTATPLNGASGLQTKLGQLSLNSSGVGAYGLSVVNGIKLIDAEMLDTPPKNPNGMVLTSDNNGIGTWKSVGSGGGSSGSTPSGLVVGGYTEDKVGLLSDVLDPWGVATISGCSSSSAYVDRLSGFLKNYATVSGSHSQFVHLCLTP